MALDFFQQYFFDPIVNFQGYNIVNTIVYAAILLIVAFVLIYPFFNKKGVKFDAKFAFSVLGFVLLGSSLRVLEDLRIFPRSANPFDLAFYTVSPGIYIAVGIFAILSLVFSLWLGKRFGKDSVKVFGVIGYIASIPSLIFVFLNFKSFEGFLAAIALAVTAFISLVFIFKFFRKTLLESSLNRLAFAGQALDGFATFTALNFYSCGEQHVVSGIILGFSPIAFPLLKTALILLILYFLDKDLKNENLKNFIKVVVVILGFAPGLRDVLTIGVGTCL